MSTFQPILRMISLGGALLILSCGKGLPNASNPPPPGTTSLNSPPYPAVIPNGELQGEANFASLLERYSKGRVEPTPWAGYWWPYSADGTAGADQKYESAFGAYGAALWERAHHGPHVDGIEDWWGHCNGWAAAAVLFKEPREPVRANGALFGVTDQKALLSEIGMEVSGDFFGHRVDNPGDSSSLDFQDVFPDQFLLVLMNIVGRGEPLIIDRYTGYQVWNQPVAGYSIDPVRPTDDLGADPSSPGVDRVMITVTIWWARDDVGLNHLTEPFEFMDGPSFGSRTLRAEIWLDSPPVFDGSGKLISSGNVILTRQGAYVLGGAWRNGNLELANSYPDYMWIPHQVQTSSGISNPYLDANRISQLTQP